MNNEIVKLKPSAAVWYVVVCLGVFLVGAMVYLYGFDYLWPQSSGLIENNKHESMKVYNKSWHVKYISHRYYKHNEYGFQSYYDIILRREIGDSLFEERIISDDGIILVHVGDEIRLDN